MKDNLRRNMRGGRHVVWMEAKRTACRVLVGKPEIKRLLEMPRRKCEYNNKMDFREKG